MHKGAGAGFHVQHDHIRVARELLGQNGTDHQRRRGHRARHIAQGIKLFIRRANIPRLTHDGKAHGIGDLDKLLARKFHRETGDRLKLIDGAAGMTKAAPRHLCQLHAAGRQHRTQHQTGLITHAAGGVFVAFESIDRGQIHHIAAITHGQGKVARFAVGHILKADGHQHGGHLIVRDRAVCVAGDHPVDLLRGQLVSGAFFQNQVAHAHGVISLFRLSFLPIIPQRTLPVNA